MKTTLNQDASKFVLMELTHHKTIDFSVPQGSIQGAYLFVCYASMLNEIVPESLTLNGFANVH